MRVFQVLAAILLVLFLLSLVRVGATVEYSKAGVLVKARLGAIRFTVFPRKPKRRKPSEPKEKGQKKKKEPEPEAEPAPQPGGPLDLFKRFLPLVTDAAGRFKRKVRLDRLYLDFTAAAADPAVAALSFGGANGAFGMIWPLLENNFTIRDRRIRTAVRFDQSVPTVYVFASLSLTIGQAVVLGARLAVRFLRILSAIKAEQKKQKEAV